MQWEIPVLSWLDRIIHSWINAACVYIQTYHHINRYYQLEVVSKLFFLSLALGHVTKWLREIYEPETLIYEPDPLAVSVGFGSVSIVIFAVMGVIASRMYRHEGDLFEQGKHVESVDTFHVLFHLAVRILNNAFLFVFCVGSIYLRPQDGLYASLHDGCICTASLFFILYLHLEGCDDVDPGQRQEEKKLELAADGV